MNIGKQDGIPVLHEYWVILLFPITAYFKSYRRRNARAIITSINDYMRIDDFYSKLAERNSYIENTTRNNRLIDNIILFKLNKKCLDLAEEALTKIDWSTYKN